MRFFVVINPRCASFSISFALSVNPPSSTLHPLTLAEKFVKSHRNPLKFTIIRKPFAILRCRNFRPPFVHFIQSNLSCFFKSKNAQFWVNPIYIYEIYPRNVSKTLEIKVNTIYNKKSNIIDSQKPRKQLFTFIFSPVSAFVFWTRLGGFGSIDKTRRVCYNSFIYIARNRGGISLHSKRAQGAG